MTRKDSVRMMHLEAVNWSGGWWQPETRDDVSWSWELKWGLMATRDSGWCILELWTEVGADGNQRLRMMYIEAENWSGGWWQPEIQSGWCILRLRNEVGGRWQPETQDDVYWSWELKWGLMATSLSVSQIEIWVWRRGCPFNHWYIWKFGGSVFDTYNCESIAKVGQLKY